MNDEFDLAVVGAGIVGLGHAAAAVERGLAWSSLERSTAIVGASVRNFGHIGTSAHSGPAADLRRTRAGSVDRPGRPGRVLDAQCRMPRGRTRGRRARRCSRRPDAASCSPPPRSRTWRPSSAAVGGMLRTERPAGGSARGGAARSLGTLPSLGVEFRWRTAALSAEPGILHTSRGEIRAGAIVFAVNFDVDQLFLELAEAHGVERSRPRHAARRRSGPRTPAADRDLDAPLLARSRRPPPLTVLRTRLEAERARALERDVNLMFTELAGRHADRR